MAGPPAPAAMLEGARGQALVGPPAAAPGGPLAAAASEPRPANAAAGASAGPPPKADMVELSADGLRAAGLPVALGGDASLPDGRPVNPAALSPGARAAVAEMVPRAAVNQQGRSGLIANAVAVLASPAGEHLPPAVRDTLAALIATAVDAHGLDGAKLRQAIERSGTFQEASILKAAGVMPGDARSQAGAYAPDALRQDAKGLLANLSAALKVVVGDKAASPPALDRGSTPPLPQRGAGLAGQAPAEAAISDRTPAGEAARTLLTAAEGALNRTRLLQAASLPEASSADPGQRPDRLVEVPISLPNRQTPIMGLAIGSDGRAGGRTGEAATAWRMRLSLDLEPSGPIHALVSLRGDQAGVTLWAERAQTADAFRSNLDELRDALIVADLEVDTLDVRDGAPPRATGAPAGTFVDLLVMTKAAPRRTAVALEYAHLGVPRVTAKGSGAIAERIVDTAKAAGVAIEENPALAEALAKVELDDEIPEALYRAVAQVILFVLRASGQLPSAARETARSRQRGS